MTIDAEQVSHTRKATGTMRYMAFALLALLLVVGLLVFRYVLYDPTRWTYRYHQRELTAIVAQVKAQSIPFDTVREFEVAHSLDPTTLAPYKEKDQYALYHIRAYRRDQDDYLISIEIDDEGHNGTFGLLYSDLPIKIVPLPGAEGGTIDGTGVLEFRELKERLSPKWSYVFEGG